MVTESTHTYLVLSFKMVHVKWLENGGESRMKGKGEEESFNCFDNLQPLTFSNGKELLPSFLLEHQNKFRKRQKPFGLLNFKIFYCPYNISI